MRIHACAHITRVTHEHVNIFRISCGAHAGKKYSFAIKTSKHDRSNNGWGPIGTGPSSTSNRLLGGGVKTNVAYSSRPKRGNHDDILVG